MPSLEASEPNFHFPFLDFLVSLLSSFSLCGFCFVLFCFRKGFLPFVCLFGWLVTGNAERVTPASISSSKVTPPRIRPPPARGLLLFSLLSRSHLLLIFNSHFEHPLLFPMLSDTPVFVETTQNPYKGLYEDGHLGPPQVKDLGNTN